MKNVSLARPALWSLAALLTLSLPLALPAQSRVPVGGQGGSNTPPAMPPEVQKAAEQYSRAVAFDKSQKWDKAIPAYEEFLKLANAAHLPARNLIEVEGRLTFLYQAKGDQKKAEASMLRIVALDPKNPLFQVQLASLYHQQQKLPQAKEYATRSLALKPPASVAALAHHILGAIAIVHQNPTEAEKEFALSIQAAPKNPQGYMDDAFALMQLKRTKEALVQAQKAATLAPNLVQAKVLVANIYQDQNRLPEALTKYDEILRTDPKNTVALYNRAAVLHRQNKPQEAITAYLAVLNLVPNSYDARYNLAQLYYAIKNYPAARQQFTLAHNLAPKDARTLGNLALAEQKDAQQQLNLAQKKSIFALAESHFKEACALAPKDISLLFSYASLLEDIGRYDEAIALYRKRLAEAPKEIDPYIRIVQAYTKQRKVDDVVKTWREYRLQEPKNPISYQAAAEALERGGRLANAIAEWKALLDTRPMGGVASNAMNSIGGDLTKLQRFDEAQAQYNAVLALDATGSYAPKDQKVIEMAAVKAERLVALRGLAEIAQQQNRPDDAIAAWEKIKAEEAPLTAKSGNLDPEPYQTIARIYEQLKKYDQAIAEYKALIALTPRSADAYTRLARVYETMNKGEEAIAAYRQAAMISQAPLPERMRIAQAYQRFNQPDKAILEYQNLRKNYPEDIQLLTALALALRQAGRDADSLEVYDALQKVDPRLTWVTEYKAIALMHLKRYPEARALYAAQIDRKPQDRQAYADLANAYKEEGKTNDFLNWLQPRFEKNPANAVLMEVVLDEFLRQNRGDAGYAYLKELAERHKTQRPVLEAYASLLAARSKGADAVEVYRKIAALAPQDVQAQIMLADQLDMNTKKEEAAKIYQAVLLRPELTPPQRLAMRRRFAQRCVLQGDLDEAIRQYQELLKANAKDFEAMAELAQTLVVAKREKEAIPYYQQLSTEMAYSPEVRADIFSKLGDIYARQNNKAEAIAQYHQAQKLNARDPAAAAGLQRLGEK